MKNFIYTLVDYIKRLDLDYPVNIGTFADEASLIVKPIKGSEVLHEYMNGVIDVRLPFSISIKSKNQKEAFAILTDVMDHMREMENFQNRESKDYILFKVVVDQLPFFEEQDDGYFYYHTKITVDLTVT